MTKDYVKAVGQKPARGHLQNAKVGMQRTCYSVSCINGLDDFPVVPAGKCFLAKW